MNFVDWIIILIIITIANEIIRIFFFFFFSMFTFPLFMATYVPIAMTAMVRKVKWDPIRHDDSASIDDMNKRKRRKASRKAK